MTKMDQKLVSTVRSDKKEREIRYIVKTYNIPVALVRAVINEVGVSRKKIYVKLLEHGYETKVIKSKK